MKNELSTEKLIITEFHFVFWFCLVSRSVRRSVRQRNAVREETRWWIPCHRQEIGFPHTSSLQTLYRDLCLHLYKIQLTQELIITKHRYCLFAQWDSERLEEDLKFERIMATRRIFEWMVRLTSIRTHRYQCIY